MARRGLRGGFLGLLGIFVHSVRYRLGRLGKGLTGLVGKRFTIMLIPHSQRGGLNLQLNVLVLVVVVLAAVGLVSSFFYYTTMYTGSSRLVSHQSREIERTERELEAVRSELNEVFKSARLFDGTLESTLGNLGLDYPEQEGSRPDGTGDLERDMVVEAVEPGQAPQVQQIQQLASFMETAVDPLEEIREVLGDQKDLLADLPNFWPIEGGTGRVVMEFGPNRHPITDQWYIHKGFDIAAPVGTPIVAGANGKVIEIGFDHTYGLYVWVRHKYGFRTRYAHLQSISVSEGQQVFQGEHIGTLGNTGRGSGSSLYFQIWLGTDVVDPAAFLKISNEFAYLGNMR